MITGPRTARAAERKKAVITIGDKDERERVDDFQSLGVGCVR